MNDDNDRTLNAYNDHPQEYIAATTPMSDSLKIVIDNLLRRVPHDGKILEIGSASGRDADYMESQGYVVERTDAAQGFIDFLEKQGHHVRQLNVLSDDFGKNYDLIYAQAVFLHLGPNQLLRVLRKAFNALKAGGILAFSVKEGKGDGWSKDYLGAPRYYRFWHAPELRQTTETAGFKKIEINTRQGSKDAWLHVIARK